MKLQDKETQSIAKSVSDVLEKKTVKEIKYPHKMYSPEGKEVTAKNKEEHESYSAKGYTHTKPVKEVDEPQAKGEKEFKAKHAVKKSGMNTDGSVTKEASHDDEDEEEEAAELSPKQKKYQAFFQKALKKFGVKSPTELDKEKRKEFFDYVDKNYEADNEEDEEEAKAVKKPKQESVTITVPGKFVAEKNVTIDVDWVGDKKATDGAAKKYKVKIKADPRKGTADITGDNKAIVKLLTDPKIYGWPKSDVLDVWPELK
tara:strand:- start:3017 stop:3790 length:774 start_codon:yes stop_codon:yes gene_type:complete